MTNLAKTTTNQAGRTSGATRRNLTITIKRTIMATLDGQGPIGTKVDKAIGKEIGEKINGRAILLNKYMDRRIQIKVS
jgi:hypothetical protein